MFINRSLWLLFPCISSILFCCYNSTKVSNSKTTQKHPELKYFINIHNWCQTRFRIKTCKSPETEIHITEPLLVGDLSAWQPTRLTKNPQAKKKQGIMFAVNSQNEISQVTKTQFLQFMFFSTSFLSQTCSLCQSYWYLMETKTVLKNLKK